MSAWAETVERRLADLERGVADARGEITRPRAGDAAIEGSIRELGVGWHVARIGTLAAGRPVIARFQAVLGSYVSGGFALSVPSVPNRTQVTMQPVWNGSAILFPLWDEATDKMLVYTTAGEVAAATDCSAASGWATVYGSADLEAKALVIPRGRILEARVLVTEELAASDSDYWTIHLRRRTAGDRDGRVFATLRTTEALFGALVAGSWRTIYEGSPIDCDEETEVDVLLDEEGEPAALVNLCVAVRVARAR